MRSLPKHAHVDWNWHISQEIYLNCLVRKSAVALTYGSNGLVVLSFLCFLVTDKGNKNYNNSNLYFHSFHILQLDWHVDS